MNKKLTQEEIDSLVKFKENYAELTNIAGSTEIQIMTLELRKEQLKNNLLQLQQEEVRLGKELEEKYGDGSISLETGEFIPKK
jgi:stress response protein YsnF